MEELRDLEPPRPNSPVEASLHKASAKGDVNGGFEDLAASAIPGGRGLSAHITRERRRRSGELRGLEPPPLTVPAVEASLPK
jgi:hypothetical protein